MPSAPTRTGAPPSAAPSTPRRTKPRPGSISRPGLHARGGAGGSPEYRRPPRSAQRTCRFPPPRTCASVFVPLHLLENHRPPDLFQTVMAMVSELPGSPLSVIVTCRVAFPSIEMMFSGFVMSWMLALPLNVAAPSVERSEESRGGEERRSRGAPD